MPECSASTLQTSPRPPWKPETAAYLCAGCGALIDEAHKGQMNARGHWVATHPGRPVAGFQLTALVSPVMRWADLVAEWLSAVEASKSGDMEPLRVFVSTSLARPFEAPGEKFDTESLSARRETYAADVPAGAGEVPGAIEQRGGEGEEVWRIAKL